MVTKFRAALAAIGLLLAAGAGVAQVPSQGAMVPNAPPLLDATGNVSRNVDGNSQPRLVPVCNNAKYQLDNTNGGTNYQTRMVYYCPNGVKAIALVFAGAYNSTATETSLVDAIPLNISIEYVASPWDATVAYTTGQQVTWNATAGNSLNPTFSAAAGNTNSMPTPGNANWSAGTTGTLVPVTCNGMRTCSVPVANTPAAVATTQGVFQTDTVPINCASACYIAVRTWINQASGKFGGSQSQNYSLGSYVATSASDITLNLTGYALGGGNASSTFTPTAVVGIPVVAKPSFCIVGDSIGSGAISQGVATVAVSNGGTGYLLGDIVTSPNTSASAGGVGDSAQFLVTGVAGSVVNSMRILKPGSYTNVATNPSQSLPSTTQSPTGGTGTGLIVTLTYNTSQYESGDATGAQGFLQRAGSAAGYTWVSFAVGGDTLAGWVSRAYTRYALIRASGCSTVIIELGTNDTAGSAATMETNLVTIANNLLSLGTVKAIIATTLFPRSASTNSYIDTANQTANANNTTRNTYNTYVRTIPAPLSSIIDMDVAMGSGSNTGLWAATGAVCPSSCDGTHLTIGGNVAAAAYVQTRLPGLMQ
jgi:lysophospholipase L1-like esterase